MFGGRTIAGFDKCHGFQVVATTNFGFSFVLDCTQQLSHCADKSVGEPNVGPAWLKPLLRGLDRCEIQRARRWLWIFGPTNCSAGHSICALNSPANINVLFGSFEGWPGPYIVPRRCT